MTYMSRLSISDKQIKHIILDITDFFLFCRTEKEIYILDSSTFQIYGVISPPTKMPISFYNVSYLHKFVVIATDITIWIYSLCTGEFINKISTPGGDSCVCLELAEDGKYFAAGYNDGYYVLYEIKEDSQKISFQEIYKKLYSHSVLSINFSSGSELVALSFENGRVIICSVHPDKKYQWLIRHDETEKAVVFKFFKHDTFQFMTKNQHGVKFYRIFKCGMNRDDESLMDEIECYRHFQFPFKELKLTNYTFSNDRAILFGSSSLKVVAWRADNGSLINAFEFEESNEKEEIQELLCHPQINFVVFVMFKASLWYWNCLTNQVKLITIQNIEQPNFLFGSWLNYSSLFILTNNGAVNFYACELNKWPNKLYNVSNSTNGWSDRIAEVYMKYIPDENLKVLKEKEKRCLSFIMEGNNELELDSESDTDDDDDYA